MNLTSCEGRKQVDLEATKLTEAAYFVAFIVVPSNVVEIQSISRLAPLLNLIAVAKLVFHCAGELEEILNEADKVLGVKGSSAQKVFPDLVGFPSRPRKGLRTNEFVDFRVRSSD